MENTTTERAKIDFVFDLLMDMFPQYEVRVLRAFAFEYRNDVDAAVEAVLSHDRPIPLRIVAASGLTDKSQDMSTGAGGLEDIIMEDAEMEDAETPALQECLTKQDACDVLPIENVSFHEENSPGKVFEGSIGEVGSTSGEVGSPLSRIILNLNTGFSEETILADDREPSQAAVKSESVTFDKLEAAIETAISGLSATLSDDSPVEDMYHSTVDSEVALSNHGSVRSSQMISTDCLDQYFTEAKGYKKSLDPEMESLRWMLKEVEMQESAADQAKREASLAGNVTQEKANEIAKNLKHAKVANEMLAGDVYGEKCILATEARELQSRLLNLSDQRDQYLSRIHEIRQKLEERLAAAHEARIKAEKEKLENEEIALKFLAEQESNMAMVAEEYRKLQDEAAENSKLEEFLTDRGHLVDMLQGELGVIFEDIQMLEQKVEGRLPMSSSVLSCSTVSSSSRRSSKITSTSNKAEEPAEALTDSKASSVTHFTSSDVEDASVESLPLPLMETRPKTASDDEWEFFEDVDFQQYSREKIFSGQIMSA